MGDATLIGGGRTVGEIGRMSKGIVYNDFEIVLNICMHVYFGPSSHLLLRYADLLIPK